MMTLGQIAQVKVKDPETLKNKLAHMVLTMALSEKIRLEQMLNGANGNGKK